MKNTHKFWPLDYDPEVEIYENLSWDLPGFVKGGASVSACPITGSPRPSRKRKRQS